MFIIYIYIFNTQGRYGLKPYKGGNYGKGVFTVFFGLLSSFILVLQSGLTLLARTSSNLRYCLTSPLVVRRKANAYY